MENYEKTVREIETIIQEIETGNIPLNLLLDKFNLAGEKLTECETFLAKNKAQMEIFLENLNPE